MNILFLGGVVPRPDDEAPINLGNFGSIQQAANVYQWNLIKGIENNLQANISILNAPFVGIFPQDSNKIIIPAYFWRHGKKTGASDYSISFINVFAIRNISRELQLKRAVTPWLTNLDDNQQNVVIVYSMHGPFLQLIKYIKRKNPRIKICLVVPDLPEYMRDQQNSSRTYRVLKHVDMLRNQECLQLVDGFVLLTEQMASKLQVVDKKYVVIEGMVDTERFTNVRQEKSPYKSIVYTGGLMKRYGLIELVDAFDRIKGKEYRLVLCGDGDAKDYILQKVQRDCRIQYLGVVSPEESLKTQQAADMLINPRPPTGEYTKYSFPSKNMEYLCAGKPVLAYKTPGIPREYDPYIHYIVGNNAVGIANAIEEIGALTRGKRLEMGKRAQRFVMRAKNINSQTMKIIQLVESLFKTERK